MQKGRKGELHKEGLNHMGGEIGSRTKAKDYRMQIDTRKHLHTHTKACQHTHVIFTLLTIKFRWSNPNYYN